MLLIEFIATTGGKTLSFKFKKGFISCFNSKVNWMAENDSDG